LASKISRYHIQQGNFFEALTYSNIAKSYQEKISNPPQTLVLSNQATEMMALREADRLDGAAELANTVGLGQMKEYGAKAIFTIDSHLVLTPLGL
jgi:hypothetical protein